MPTEDDIYKSKKQWATIVRKIEEGIYLKPDKKTRYFIRNKANTEYFKKLIKEFEFMESSYIRRIQFLKALRKVCYFSKKDLKGITREDVKDIIRQANSVNKTPITQRAFIDYNKQMWKILFPEKDNQGREDETIVPHAWRIKTKYDPSKKKDRQDKFTIEELDKIMKLLSNDPRMQLFFSMLYYNLARPQELCYIDLQNVEVFDNYARIRISEHGKEGTKTLQLVDNYYFLSEWLNKHPFWKQKGKEDTPLFITLGRNSRYERLNPKHTSKILKRVLKELKIDKPLSNYSFKRNGVTHKYILGESAQSIQKTAGWTSTSQLRVYDLSTQEEFQKKELIEKGILKGNGKDNGLIQYKLCAFCNDRNPHSNTICSRCNRPLNREDILNAEREKENSIKELETKMKDMKEYFKGEIANQLKELKAKA